MSNADTGTGGLSNAFSSAGSRECKRRRAARGNGMSKRILVVEDQPDNRQIIRDMLANLQTARVLGIDVPSGLLSIADEVIE